MLGAPLLFIPVRLEVFKVVVQIRLAVRVMISRLHSEQDGFSFIGVMLVVLILSITTATLVTLVQPAFKTRELKVTLDRVALLRPAIADYIQNHGTLTPPPTLDDLVTTDGTACVAISDPNQGITYLTLQGWCGPYIDVIFTQNLSEFKTDGWGTLFVFVPATQIIRSCGPNRICGDADDLLYSP